MKEAALRNGELHRVALSCISKRKTGAKNLHPAGKVSLGLSRPLAPEDSQTDQARGEQ